jgi:hypothetical protein
LGLFKNVGEFHWKKFITDITGRSCTLIKGGTVVRWRVFFITGFNASEWTEHHWSLCNSNVVCSAVSFKNPFRYVEWYMSAAGKNAVSVLLTVVCSLCAFTNFSEDCLFLVLIFLLNSSWYEHCVI